MEASFGSQRAAAIPRSVFAVMDVAKASAREAGLSIADMSIGSSDLSPPAEVLEVLRASVLDSRCHRYPLPSDSRVFQSAAATYLSVRFGIEIDPTTEVLPCSGAQEALAQLLLAATDPGDVILLCDPCYAPYLGAAACAGLHTYAIPISVETGLPDLLKVPADIALRTRVVLLNYPSNPCSQLASAGIFSDVAGWCKMHNTLLIHDAPYVELTFGGYTAPIALVSRTLHPECRIVEIFSLSKSHSMGGFRIGFVAGDAAVISSLSRVQSVFGFGPPLALQLAAAAALTLPEEVVRTGAAIFGDRRDALVTALKTAGGWTLPNCSESGEPGASMYVWASHPRISELGGSVAFSVALASETGVAVAPGRAFGLNGEGFVRFALVLPPEKLKDAVERIQRWFESGHGL